MSIKCKYADIKEIYDWYEQYGDEKLTKYYGLQPSIHSVAYYTPSQANWSYIIGLLMVDGCVYKVVTVFGQIKAIMPLQLYNYDYNELKKD